MEKKETLSSVKNTQEYVQIMLDAVPLCCNLWTEDFKNIDCNQEAVNLFELSSKQEYLDRFFELSPEYQPDGQLSAEKAVEKITEAFKTGHSRFEWTHRKLNGEPIPSEITLVRVKYGEIYLVAGYTRDLREIQTSIKEAREAEERMRIMFDALPLCCNLWNEEFVNIDCNQEAVNLFELSCKQEYLDRFFELSPEYQPDGRLSAEKAAEKITEAFKIGNSRFEWMHQKLNGEPIPSEIVLMRVKYGENYVVAGYTRDLREIKGTVRLLNQLEQLAFMDAVTGIHNRHHFMDHARKFFGFSYDQRPISIMMMDLDWFKQVNDTYGHAAGDEILKAVAQVTKSSLRDSDLLARYGGEEFIILVFDANKDIVIKLAERIRSKIASTPFYFQGIPITITVSLGVAIKNETVTSLEELMQVADKALYKAKANGRNRIEFG